MYDKSTINDSKRYPYWKYQSFDSIPASKEVATLGYGLAAGLNAVLRVPQEEDWGMRDYVAAIRTIKETLQIY